jgi:Flp pilus assembly protein TadB
MNEAKMNDNKFVINEYIEVTIRRELAPLCSDCYHALGWTITDSRAGIDTVALKLQRDRKIKNRSALSELQRKCEVAFGSIEKLEKSKASKATVISLSVGMAGTAFLAGAVFAYLASSIILCIILALPGFVGWALPVLLYKKYLKESTDKINPMIEKYYDIIYEACDKASQMLE